MATVGTYYSTVSQTFVPPTEFKPILTDYVNVRVTDSSKGKAVQARYDFQQGAVLFGGWGTFSTERTMYTIQISRDSHIVPEEPIAFLNHSCAPNCGLLINTEENRLEVHALHDIRAGDEITIDYATFETEISSMPDCLCGQACCRRSIKGFADLTDTQRASYGRYIAPYLLGK
jgi:hypothetical protein